VQTLDLEHGYHKEKSLVVLQETRRVVSLPAAVSSGLALGVCLLITTT
jgi:hypothetical protein